MLRALGVSGFRVWGFGFRVRSHSVVRHLGSLLEFTLGQLKGRGPMDVAGQQRAGRSNVDKDSKCPGF